MYKQNFYMKISEGKEKKRKAILVRRQVLFVGMSTYEQLASITGTSYAKKNRNFLHWR